MDFSSSDAELPIPYKIIIAGGFGAGKTTLVGSVSEIEPLSTEERLTQAGTRIDNLDGIEEKTTTTVALDFGRITMPGDPPPDLVLYLFGTPGQDRFWYMWNDLVIGAIGAIVMIDTRRLDLGFAAVDFFENRRIPFIIAVNCFNGVQRHNDDAVRSALDLRRQETPLLFIDARRREDNKRALVTLVRHAMTHANGGTAATAAAHAPTVAQ
jgi:uncharacterized protein